MSVPSIGTVAETAPRERSGGGGGGNRGGGGGRGPALIQLKFNSRAGRHWPALFQFSSGIFCAASLSSASPVTRWTVQSLIAAAPMDR